MKTRQDASSEVVIVFGVSLSQGNRCLRIIESKTSSSFVTHKDNVPTIKLINVACFY